jgi:hypothetical protein
MLEVGRYDALCEILKGKGGEIESGMGQRGRIILHHSE